MHCYVSGVWRCETFHEQLLLRKVTHSEEIDSTTFGRRAWIIYKEVESTNNSCDILLAQRVFYVVMYWVKSGLLVFFQYALTWYLWSMVYARDVKFRHDSILFAILDKYAWRYSWQVDKNNSKSRFSKQQFESVEYKIIFELDNLNSQTCNTLVTHTHTHTWTKLIDPNFCKVFNFHQRFVS